jgi:hypothetical protein
VTYVFVKHRRDGKYEIRFRARDREDYRQLLMSLQAYVSVDSRAFDFQAKTWLVEGKCQREIERWLARVVEDLNPSVEFFCERQDAWKEAVEESYRTLHVLPSAPWQVVRGAYHGLVELYRTTDGEPGRLERVNVAYERLKEEFEKDDSSERES